MALVVWPSPPTIAIGLAPPLAAFILALVLKDRWDFQGIATDHRPQIVLFYLLPTLAAVFRAVFGYKIVDYTPLLLMAVLIVALAFALLLAFRPSARRLSLGHAGLALLFWLYGYAAVVHINVQFDSSEPQVFQVAVLESTSGDKEGELKLAPWGPYSGTYRAELPLSQQRQIPAGATMQAGLYKGALGARWWALWTPEELSAS